MPRERRSGSPWFMDSSALVAFRYAAFTIAIVAAPASICAQSSEGKSNSSTQLTQRQSKQQIAEIKAVHKVTEEARNAELNRMWGALDRAGRDGWNTYLGILLGRAEQYETLQKTVAEAEIAYESGKLVWGASKTWEAVKQISELVTKVGGPLTGEVKLKIPTNEKEAREFAKAVLEKAKEIGSDARSLLQDVGVYGDASQKVENYNASLTDLDNYLSDLENQMVFAPEGPANDATKSSSTSDITSESSSPSGSGTSGSIPKSGQTSSTDDGALKIEAITDPVLPTKILVLNPPEPTEIGLQNPLSGSTQIPVPGQRSETESSTSPDGNAVFLSEPFSTTFGNNDSPGIAVFGPQSTSSQPGTAVFGLPSTTEPFGKAPGGVLPSPNDQMARQCMQSSACGLTPTSISFVNAIRKVRADIWLPRIRPAQLRRMDRLHPRSGVEAASS